MQYYSRLLLERLQVWLCIGENVSLVTFLVHFISHSKQILRHFKVFHDQFFPHQSNFTLKLLHTIKSINSDTR